MKTRPKMNFSYQFSQYSSVLRIIVLGVIFTSLTYYFVGKYTGPLNSKIKLEKVKILSSDVDYDTHSTGDPNMFSYLAVIDAGSSGSRAHVYRYGMLDKFDGPLYVLPKHESFKTKPGLSSYASSPGDAGNSMESLVNFLKEKVPESMWQDTPIWLKATAGLRLLDESISESILDSVRQYLSDKNKSPFQFRKIYAKVISGNEEGAFGWIAFNYLKKVIGPKRSSHILPYAVVEMGGASSQVTQLAGTPIEISKIPEKYKYSFYLGADEYQVYTHSYLGYGADKAKENYKKALNKIPTEGDSSSSSGSGSGSSSTMMYKDPCLNSGTQVTIDSKDKIDQSAAMKVTYIGDAHDDSCIHHISSTLFQSSITCDEKESEPPYSFGCIHQPHFIKKSPNFLAFENFYYMSSAIGIPSDFSHSSISSSSSIEPSSTSSSLSLTPIKFPLITTPDHIKKAAKMICNTTWDSLQSHYPIDDQPKDINEKLCFSASYAYSFLHHGLGIPSDKKITIQKYVDGSEIEWALGAAVKEISDLMKAHNLRSDK